MGTKYSNYAGETIVEFAEGTVDDDGVEFTLYYTEGWLHDPREYAEPAVSVFSVDELIILRDALDIEIEKRV